MKVQNKSKDPVILGAVHNGRFEESVLVIFPGQVMEINEKRLDFYDPKDLKALREVSADAKITPPALSMAEPKKPALEDTEIAEQELMKTLAAANNVGAQ